MAQLDLITAQAKYKAIVQEFYLKALEELEVGHEVCPLQTRFQLVYGYAALLAYHAYSDESFLRAAEKHWNLGLSFTLTDSDITAGISGVKNFSIASRCPNGATLVGGTFSLTVSVGLAKTYKDPDTIGHYQDDRSNVALNAAATGDFLILSAALSSTTSNRTYLELAQKSADFIQRHMYYKDGLFYNQLNSTNCSPWTSKYPYDSGSIIHGLSLLSSLTQDMSTMDFIRKIVGWTTSVSDWHSTQSNMILNLEGVQYSNGGEPKAHLMRGYTELFRANTTPTDLKLYLGSYISTQFNAVADLARSEGSNIYGPQYDGPRGAQFNSDSQAGAIAALLGGLTVGGNNSSTEPPGTPDSSAGSGPRSRSVPVGAIVGGVIGGIALAGLVAASLWVYRRRVRAKSRDHETVTPWEAPAPFLDTTARLTGGKPPPPSGTSTVLGGSDASSDSGATSTPGFERQWDPNELPPEYSTQIGREPVERGKRTTG
ncbi:hypothetical protein PM082_018556 [Marasmius tenuissimus]|nr:hypothetical protein PM082_018556 [Marasmius tenuissimus]